MEDLNDFKGLNGQLLTFKEEVKAANKIGHPKVSENFYDGFREASMIKKES